MRYHAPLEPVDLPPTGEGPLGSPQLGPRAGLSHRRDDEGRCRDCGRWSDGSTGECAVRLRQALDEVLRLLPTARPRRGVALGRSWPTHRDVLASRYGVDDPRVDALTPRPL